jgi:hypothetical protein
MKNKLNKMDEVSRRRFMATAAKSFLGVSAFGMNSSAWAAPVPVARKKPAKRLIYLFMNGGMSQMDTLDPKPGHENMGPTKTIQTNVDGLQFAHNFKNLSQYADKMAVIRSLYTTAGVHFAGDYLMHTSYDPRNTIRHPGMGAWALKFKGKLNPNLPGSVFIGGNSRINGGGGFFEPEFEPLAINKPESGLQFSKRKKHQTEEMFHDGLKLMNDLDQKFAKKYDQKHLRAHSEMYDQATRLMTSKDLEAFDLKKESKETLAAYGDSEFGRGCLLARRLIEKDVRAVEVNNGGWDTHVDNFINQPERAAELDKGLSALLNDLKERNLLDDTLIVLTTEFGRTPKINQNLGRDHYPQAFSVALMGGGIKGGTVHGVTSPSGEEIIENKVKVRDFNATIAYGLGLPLGQVVMSPSLRPFKVGNKGKALTSLYS